MLHCLHRGSSRRKRRPTGRLDETGYAVDRERKYIHGEKELALFRWRLCLTRGYLFVPLLVVDIDSFFILQNDIRAPFFFFEASAFFSFSPSPLWSTSAHVTAVVVARFPRCPAFSTGTKCASDVFFPPSRRFSSVRSSLTRTDVLPTLAQGDRRRLARKTNPGGAGGKEAGSVKRKEQTPETGIRRGMKREN